jgi:hypothetical protein
MKRILALVSVPLTLIGTPVAAQTSINARQVSVGGVALNTAIPKKADATSSAAALDSSLRVDAAQPLSDAQRATARANIGAIDQAALDSATATTYIKVALRSALAASAIGNSASDADKVLRSFNTAAMATAIAKAKATVAMANTSGRAKNKAVLLLGSGTFAFEPGTNFLVNFAGLEVRGEGKYSTTLLVNTSTALFDFGTPVTSLSRDVFVDGAQDWGFRDLAIYNTSYLSTSNHGSRIGSAIRDNGSGGGLLDHVRIGGFKYGVNLVFGSDFTKSIDLYVELCDVGLYLGPGSQQTIFLGFDAYLNREGVVMDRPGQTTWMAPVFNSSALANVTIEAPGTRATRQLTKFSPSGTTLAGAITIADAWYESFAGGLGDVTIPDYHNQVSSAAAQEPYRNLRIIRPFIVSGANSATRRRTQGFLGAPNDGTLGAYDSEVTDPVISGYIVYWLVRQGNNVTLRNPRGSADILMSNLNSLDVYQDGTRLIRRRDNILTNPIDRIVGNYPLSIGVRERVSGNGQLSWGYATAADTWAQGLSVDLSTKRLFMGDMATSTTPSVSWASSMPTSGTYGVGSVVHNSAPTVANGRILLEWVRLTTGSGHVAGIDWQAIYGPTS